MPECLVCKLRAEGETHFPADLPELVWMCQGHWSTYVALALGPSDYHLNTRVRVIESHPSEPESTP